MVRVKYNRFWPRLELVRSEAIANSGAGVYCLSYLELHSYFVGSEISVWTHRLSRHHDCAL